MRKLLNLMGAFIVVIMVGQLACAQPASPISAELAKKCRELAIKAHPTPKVGTKAVGTEKAQRDYYQACITKRDKMEK